MIAGKPSGMTHLLDRLRNPARRHALLIGVLLALACAPFAQALPTPGLTVLVPFCSADGQTPGAAPGRQHSPGRIALHFTAALPGAASVPAMAPPPPHAGPRAAAAACCAPSLARHAPTRPVSVSRRPPPRAPPWQPARA